MVDLNRQYPVNQPKPGRLKSRNFRIIIPAPIITASGVGYVRIRSRSANTTISGDFDAGVVVGQSGAVWVGPVNTPAPTDATSTLNSAFIELGFTSEDGILIQEEIDLEKKSSWSSFYPTGFYVNDRRTSFQFTLREFTRRSLEFALEGTTAGTAPGPYSYAAATTDIMTRALVIDWRDGVRRFRLYIPKGSVDVVSSSNISRRTPTDLPVVFSAHKYDTNPYTWFISLV